MDESQIRPATKKLLFPLAALVAGLLAVFSLAPYKFWIAAPIATTIFYFCLEKQSTNKAQLRIAIAYHLGLFGFGASWIYYSIHDYGYTGKPLAFLLTFLFCSILAITNALFFYIYIRLRDTNHLFSTRNILLFAGIATLVEASRSWIYSGFPWLLIGYSQTESPFAPLATIFGVYGLSLWVYLTGAIIAAIIFLASQKSSRNPIHSTLVTSVAIGIGTSVLSIMVPASWTQTKGSVQSVAMIQANISQHEKWRPSKRAEIIDSYYDATVAELEKHKLILWPEAAVPLYHDMIDRNLGQLNDAAIRKNTAIVYGVPSRELIVDDAGKQRTLPKNSVATMGSAEGLYHKRHLVPFGEYIPFEGFFGTLMKVFNLPLSSMQPGKDDQAPLTIFNWRSIPLICYEIVFPGMTANAARKSDVLITVSNDTWFGASIGPLQHLQMAQMRALENGRYVLRSTGSGVTAIIKPDGSIAAQAPQFEEAILRGEFYLMDGLTPWTKWGYWLIHLICALCVLPAIVLRFK